MISDKGLFGMFSGVLTTVMLQPFENVKMALMIPPKNLRLKSNFLINMQIAAQYIANHEGLRGFYKGVVAGTSKAAIGCYTYFAILRTFEGEEQKAMHNFFFSSIARIISTIITNPLNIIETRF